MAPNPSKEQTVSWTRNMDDALIDAFMAAYNEGGKVNGTFTCKAYDNIVLELSGLFGQHIDKDKVKNRWKTLKKNFAEVCDIFKNLSGFAWNPTTKLWEAEPEVWAALIEAKPKAAMWRTTPFPNYGKMMVLYGVDRANGEESETIRDFRKRRRSHEEFNDTFNDITNLVSQGGFTANNVDSFAEIDRQANLPGTWQSFEQDHSPSVYSSGGKRAKRASRQQDNHLKDLAGVMSAVAEAINRGTDAFIETAKMKAPQLSGEELWKILEDCGCDAERIPDIYCFLMGDIDKLRIAVQCPPSARRMVIMKMFYNSL